MPADTLHDEPVVPVWFFVWALFVAGVLLIPDEALLVVVEWLFADGFESLGERRPAPFDEVIQRGLALTFRVHGVVFAVGYLAVRFLTRRPRRDAERVEQGLAA